MATSLYTLPAHLLPLAMEEFPQSLALVRVCKGHREHHLRRQPCPFSDITEEEEGGSSLEEDQAQRSFLKSLENLRRSTQGPSCNVCRVTPTRSVDSAHRDAA